MDFIYSIEEDFITWREKFWPTICEHFGVKATGDQVRYLNLFNDEDLYVHVSKTFSLHDTFCWFQHSPV